MTIKALLDIRDYSRGINVKQGEEFDTTEEVAQEMLTNGFCVACDAPDTDSCVVVKRTRKTQQKAK